MKMELWQDIHGEYHFLPEAPEKRPEDARGWTFLGYVTAPFEVYTGPLTPVS